MRSSAWLAGLVVAAGAAGAVSSGAAAQEADAGQQAAEEAAAARDAAPTPANPADVASVDAILEALYDVISGPAGETRDWDRFRSLFLEGARLIPVQTLPDGSARPHILAPEDYIELAGPQLEGGGFFEHEIGRVEERFGHIVHAFSTYEARRGADDAEPFMRGINSIQLVHDGERWWVATILWDSERPDNPIPNRYLGS